jgi:hypothetical protein
MHARGRPVLGAFAGFGFGGFLALALLVFGVLASNSIILLILPFAFLVLGIVWAFVAPLGRRRPPPQAAPQA